MNEILLILCFLGNLTICEHFNRLSEIFELLIGILTFGVCFELGEAFKLLDETLLHTAQTPSHPLRPIGSV